MKTLYLPKTETAALRSICSGDDRIASWMLPRLTKEHFSWGPCADAYRRMAFLTHKDGEIPRWDDLLEDMAIAEDSREELTSTKASNIVTRREAKLIVQRLDEYRRARALMGMSRHIARSLREDKVDLPSLTDEVGDMLSGARGTGNMEDKMFSFGGPQIDKRALIEVMRASRDEFIPTGIKAFDLANQGVPRGSAWLMCGTTGGGKTVLGMQVGLHQARLGAKVALVSLEMSRLDMMRRVMSHLTRIPLSQISRPYDLDQSTRKTIIGEYKEYHHQVANNGGRFTLITPDEEVAIEDVLSLLKPRGYDNIIIDYIGLLKNMDGEDQWRRMGAAVRMGKIFTNGSNSIITLLAQLSAEGIIRYSRTMAEHASLMWSWIRAEKEFESGIITVNQPKARNLKSFPFQLKTLYHIMRLEGVDVPVENAPRKGKPKTERKPTDEYQL